jgi:hypothetical protein
LRAKLDGHDGQLYWWLIDIYLDIIRYI